MGFFSPFQRTTQYHVRQAFRSCSSMRVCSACVTLPVDGLARSSFTLCACPCGGLGVAEQHRPLVGDAFEVVLAVDEFPTGSAHCGRRAGLVANRAMAAGQSWSFSGMRPVSPGPGPTPAFAPTGEAITGKPAAMYCTILKPHLPSVHRSLGVRRDADVSLAQRRRLGLGRPRLVLDSASRGCSASGRRW